MKWIKCSDELPHVYDDVFIYPQPDLMGYRYTGCLDSEEQWICEYEDSYQNHNIVVKVTHWAAITKPEDV
jgi:hypothetical protein